MSLEEYVMDTDRFNKWLTLAANVGVFIGLILVAYEVDQSGTNLELTASSDTADGFVQAMEVLAQNEELARLIFRAESSYSDLDDFDKWRVSKYLDGFTTMASQDYLVTLRTDRDIGSMEEDWRENMRLQMYREYWARKQGRFRPEFQEFINGILEEPNDR